MRHRLILIIAAILALLAGVGITAAAVATSPAHAATVHTAGNYPTPTVTPTHPIVSPTPTVTVTVTPTPPPVVNPFARCSFTFTRADTFVPRLGRFVQRIVPAIACVSRGGAVSVYDLVSG